MKRSLTSMLGATALMLMSLEANAGNRILGCSIGEKQGTARVEVLRVERHPEFLVFKLTMATKLARPAGSGPTGGVAHLSGLLTAQISSKGAVFAAGLVDSQRSGDVLINPQWITLQGTVRSDGSYVLELHDSDRILQLGYGVTFYCH